MSASNDLCPDCGLDFPAGTGHRCSGVNVQRLANRVTGLERRMSEIEKGGGGVPADPVAVAPTVVGDAAVFPLTDEGIRLCAFMQAVAFRCVKMASSTPKPSYDDFREAIANSVDRLAQAFGMYRADAAFGAVVTDTVRIRVAPNPSGAGFYVLSIDPSKPFAECAALGLEGEERVNLFSVQFVPAPVR